MTVAVPGTPSAVRLTGVSRVSIGVQSPVTLAELVELTAAPVVGSITAAAEASSRGT